MKWKMKSLVNKEKRWHTNGKDFKSSIWRRTLSGRTGSAEIRSVHSTQEKALPKLEDFIKKLKSPLDKEFIRIIDEQLDAVPLELSETFISGFRLGAKMMIEVFEDSDKKEARCKYQNIARTLYSYF